jgi:hypothetical protein
VEAARGALLRAEESTVRGEAPTDAAARRLQALERTAAADASSAVGRADGGGAAQSTAELRPNAYIPDVPGGLGLPRPYGAHAPFKPAPAKVAAAGAAPPPVGTTTRAPDLATGW